MTNSKPQSASKTKTLFVFILTIILGYGLFIIPDIFFGVTKINGGKTGINLFLIALFQFTAVTLLLSASLKTLNKDWKSIGLNFINVKKDVLMGLLFGLLWTLLQFGIIIPNTGGANRVDIQGMLSMCDGTILGTISFIALGVIGGGITEELFNRGYFINTLQDIFKKSKNGIWLSATLSIVLFSLGHLPADSLDWFDILVPTVMYTLLFLTTKRLTASMVAHGSYNMLAILLTHYQYHQ